MRLAGLATPVLLGDERNSLPDSRSSTAFSIFLPYGDCTQSSLPRIPITSTSVRPVTPSSGIPPRARTALWHAFRVPKTNFPVKTNLCRRNVSRGAGSVSGSRVARFAATPGGRSRWQITHQPSTDLEELGALLFVRSQTRLTLPSIDELMPRLREKLRDLEGTLRSDVAHGRLVLGSLFGEHRLRVHRDGRIEGFARLTPDTFALPRTPAQGRRGRDPGESRPRLILPIPIYFRSRCRRRVAGSYRT